MLSTQLLFPFKLSSKKLKKFTFSFQPPIESFNLISPQKEKDSDYKKTLTGVEKNALKST